MGIAHRRDLKNTRSTVGLTRLATPSPRKRLSGTEITAAAIAHHPVQPKPYRKTAKVSAQAAHQHNGQKYTLFTEPNPRVIIPR